MSAVSDVALHLQRLNLECSVGEPRSVAASGGAWAATAGCGRFRHTALQQRYKEQEQDSRR